MTDDGPADRGAGHRRARRVQPAADGPDDRPRRRGHPAAVRAPARRPSTRRPASERALLVATTNRGQAARVPAPPGRARRRGARPRDQLGLDLDVPEPLRHVRRERHRQGPSPTASPRRSITVADDSGIEVAALDWGPGVRSARWGTGAGSQAEQLVAAVGNDPDRRARMVCALAVAIPGDPDPSVELFGGIIEGRVAPRAAWSRRIRLRPDLPPAERRHDRGAAGGREGSDQPPRPCGRRRAARASQSSWRRN